jgi:hypothetical protein
MVEVMLGARAARADLLVEANPPPVGTSQAGTSQAAAASRVAVSRVLAAVRAKLK